MPTPNEIVALLSECVIGQENAKQAIAVAVYNHFINCAQSDLTGQRVECENHVLLAGPSGSGKSLLLRTLVDVLGGLPMYFSSCATISPEGYKGRNLTQHLDAIAESIYHKGRTQPAIVVWDEVDKLALNKDSASEAAIYRRMVQNEFLTYLHGSKCGSDRELDSSKILNIAMGAFVGIDAIRDTKPKPTIGFQSQLGPVSGGLSPLAPEHLIRFGLIPEFIGRFSRLAALDPLNRCAMRRILTEAQGNVLARRKEFFALHKIQLEFTDDALDALITKALALGTGARALCQIIDQSLRGVECQLPEMALRGVHTLVVDRSALLGQTPPMEHAGKPLDLSELYRVRSHAIRSKPTDASDESYDDLGIF